MLTLFFMTTFIVAFTMNYIISEDENKKSDGRELYGEYDAIIMGVSYSEAESLATDSVVEGYSICEYEHDYDNSSIVIKADKDLFEISNYEILNGRFPENDYEIMCDGKFLSQIGCSSIEDAPIINRFGREYKIVGQFDKKELSQSVGVYTPLFISKIEKEKSGECNIYIKLSGDDCAQNAKYLLDKYGIENGTVTYNYDFLGYTERNEHGEYTGIWMRLYIGAEVLIVILTMYIVYKVTVIYIRKSEYNYYIIIACGVKPHKIAMQIAKLICCGWGGLGILNSVLVILYNAVYTNLKGRETFFAAGIEKIICVLAVMAIIIGGMVYIRAEKILNEKTKDRLNNKENISKPVKKVKMKSSFVKFMGNNTIAMKKWQYLAFFFCIVVSVTGFVAVSYMLNNVFEIKDENGYDYRADYIYSSPMEMTFGIKNMEQKYQSIQAEAELFKIYPIYFKRDTIKIKKTCPSAEYIEYKKATSPEWKTVFRNIDNSKYDDEVTFVGMDEEGILGLCEKNNIKKTKLNDGECLCVKDIRIENSDSIEWGVDTGKEILLETYDFDNMDKDGNVSCERVKLQVAGSVGSIPVKNKEFDYNPIVIVNMNVFYKMVEYKYPQIMYVDRKEGTEDEIKRYFSDLGGISLVDLQREKEAVYEQKFRVEIMAGVLTAGLIFVLIINVYIMLNEAFESNKRQIKVLKIIGIDNKKVVMIQFWIYMKLYIYSMLVSNIISILFCYAAALYLKNQIGHFEFFVPYGTLIFANVLVTVMFAGVAWLLSRRTARL